MRRQIQDDLDCLWRIVEDLHQSTTVTHQTVDHMSSARCRQVKLALGSCLGEKKMKFTNEMDHTTLDQDLMMGRRLRPERWSEHFQDLSGWCQPNKMSNISSSQQSDEQLNTPIVTVQDEFDFGVRSTECPLMSEVDCDLWDTSIPNTQGELWDSVNDWLTYSPPSTVEDNNNMFLKKEIVRSDGDFLLSQSPLICKIKTEKTIKEPLTNIKNEEQDIFKSYCVKSENSSFALNRPIKKEPFFNIFQSEEPFINDMDSCTYTPDKILSPIDINRDDMVAAEEVVITTEEEPTTQPDIPESTTFIKPEPAPAPVKAEHTNHSAFVLTEEVIKSTVRRPKLELDIDAAMMTTQAETMDTPEVLQPLVEGIDGFSLLSYVCDDETNVLSAITGKSPNQMTCLTIPPQKKLYSESVKMPYGKYVKRKKQSSIPEEIAEPTSTLLVSNRPKRKSAENFNKLVSKKRRFTDDSDDIESLNSIDTSILSDSDESFSVISKSARKKYTNKTNIGRRRKISSVDSDLESVSSTTDRYRELRDRNNEASRKSRLNRKSKEIEMKGQAIQLEKENRLLKMKADEMERLVKKLRDNLMQIVLKRS